jgi:hypothetical protein
MSRTFALFLAVALVPSAQAQNVTRTRRGDTAVMVTQGNGKWGPPHDAIEVLRVPNDTHETTFGAAYTIQATPDGGVIVVDTKSLDGLIVRQFDANGKFVRNLGRSGQGPGEYIRAGSISITVSPKGSVYLRDSDKSVSIWGPDGKLTYSFALNHNNGSTNEIVVATDGSMYLRAPFDRIGTASATRQMPMLHYSADGRLLDSISTNVSWLPEGTEASQWSRLLPDGRLLATRTDKVGFLISQRSGAATVQQSQSGRGALEPARETSRDGAPRILVAEIPGGPVPYLREEREELQLARNLALDKCQNARRERVVVPEAKLPARGGSPDIDGRIWIGKSTPSQKIPPKVSASCSSAGVGSFKAEVTYEEPPVYVAFMPDGTFLGEVRFPLRARVTFVGNYAWALIPDDDDVQTLVKYRLY